MMSNLALRRLRARSRQATTLATTLALAAALLCAQAAQAQSAPDYIVELVLFEHLGAQAPGGGGVWYAAPRSAITLGSESAAARGFVPVEGPLTLADDVDAMTSSGRYRVLQHYRWRQPGLAAADAVRIRIALGSPLQLYVGDDAGGGDFLPASLQPRPGREREVRTATLDGTLKLRLGRFLHLESRLVYTDVDGGRSYRLDESRKMRSRELHYIDNPRIGILTRIVPADEDDAGSDAEPETADEATTVE